METLEKIEKLYEDLNKHLSTSKPVNELQEGFDMATQFFHSKLAHILGKSKIYKFDELEEFLK